MMKKLNFGTSELSFDPNLMVQMRADTLNATAGDLKGYDCPTCKNRGFITFVSEAGTLMTRDCSCMQVRKCLRQGSRSGLQAMLREKRFENFQIHQPWQKKMLPVAALLRHLQWGLQELFLRFYDIIKNLLVICHLFL